jgi:hypothetical protein
MPMDNDEHSLSVAEQVPYEPPSVEVVGDIAELTRGNNGTVFDPGNMMFTKNGGG